MLKRFGLHVLILLVAVPVWAQNASDAGYFFEPKILALDQPISAAQRFNDSIAKIAQGYDLILTDRETPGMIKQIYKTQENETLRLEFQYRRSDSGGNPVIVMQRINGNPLIISRIYNYLFDANIDPGSVTALATPGKDMYFQNAVYQFILESDDYSPGYWSIVLIR